MDEKSMVCVGGQGSSVCMGDSGGPLSCQESGKWVVRGAASWVTSRTCPGNTYSVYARVSSYVDWINKYVQGKLQNVICYNIICRWSFYRFKEKRTKPMSRRFLPQKWKGHSVFVHI